MSRKLIFFILFFLFTACFSQRNPFVFQQSMSLDETLKQIMITDLKFAGAITLSDTSVAFAQDLLGNIYPLIVGQRVGRYSAQVISILSEKIILVENGHYLFIQ